MADFAVISRRSGRLVAALLALAALCWAGYVAFTASIPAVRVYDGFWMLGGAALLVAIVAPLVWRWPRDRALLAVTGAALVGAWCPLVFLALHAGIPVWARLKGAWVLTGADVVGIAVPVAVAFAWLALRAPGTAQGMPATSEVPRP